MSTPLDAEESLTTTDNQKRRREYEGELMRILARLVKDPELNRSDIQARLHVGGATLVRLAKLAGIALPTTQPWRSRK